MEFRLEYSVDERESIRKGQRKERKRKHRKRIPLWYFLYELLEVDMNSELIRWVNREKLEFLIKNPEEVAKLWGLVKEKSTMTYAKLARGIRYYYGKEVIEKVSESRFAYRFILSHKTKSVIKSGNDTASAPTSPAAIPKRLHTYSDSSSPLPHSPLLLDQLFATSLDSVSHDALSEPTSPMIIPRRSHTHSHSSHTTPHSSLSLDQLYANSPESISSDTSVCGDNHPNMSNDNMEFFQEEIISVSSPESICSCTDTNTDISMYGNYDHGQETNGDLWMISNSDIGTDERFLNELIKDLDFSSFSSDSKTEYELQDISLMEF